MLSPLARVTWFCSGWMAAAGAWSQRTYIQDMFVL